MEDIRDIWSELGINLENHDALLEVLPPLFKETFHTQEGRPRGMVYFDGFTAEVHGARIRELVEHRRAGGIVVGGFCTYVPEELVLAAGGILVGLCSGADFALDEVEKELPRNVCALIKSSYGFKIAGVCPYIEASDLVVGETTCDGKKKYYEILGQHQPVYVMELPQTRGERAQELWRGEVRAFAAELERVTGNRITEEALREGTRKVNAKRRALQRLARLRYADTPVISGKDSLLIAQIAFIDDIERFTKKVEKLCDELQERIAAGDAIGTAAGPRIMVSGCPMAIPNWKLPHIIEGSGATIVAEELCTGARYYRDLTDEDANDLPELLDAIAARYLKIDCAVFTPNPDRLENIIRMARDSKADGVVYYALKFCDPYTIEAGGIRAALEEAGIPVLYIETDYSAGDAGQLATRVEAFFEMMLERVAT
ncbi:MAG: double-cubane-cluster-containing anaerobic reductase [Candidatus Geothermincolia bacterium]